jgi:hypothetical protein
MAIALLVVLLALCVLAPFLGADSRVADEHDRRGWLPGSRALR